MEVLMICLSAGIVTIIIKLTKSAEPVTLTERLSQQGTSHAALHGRFVRLKNDGIAKSIKLSGMKGLSKSKSDYRSFLFPRRYCWFPYLTLLWVQSLGSITRRIQLSGSFFQLIAAFFHDFSSRYSPFSSSFNSFSNSAARSGMQSGSASCSTAHCSAASCAEL